MAYRLKLCLPLLFLAIGAGMFASEPSQKPNIIFLLADDLGFGDLACYGAKDIRTPRLDRLAREGVHFTQFYANGPECTPTRAAFLTGRYQQRIGGLECAIGIGGVGRYDDAIRLAAKHELGLPATEPSIANLLRNTGYATALTGKWHLGYENHFAPNRHGFDYAFYCLGGGMDYFHHVEEPPSLAPSLRLNTAPITRPGYATDLFADEAIQWLREHKRRCPTQPVFLYIPFTAPHAPFQGPDEHFPEPLPASSDRWKQSKAPQKVYAAMIERLDAAVGNILDAVEELRLTGNTLVIFCSDNGGTASARPCGLRGIKGTAFEGGIRVPCIVRWPGVLKAGARIDQPAATFDLTASIASAAGTTPQLPYDGVNILGAIARNESVPSRPLFWRGRRGNQTWRAVRDGDMKYVTHSIHGATEEFLFNVSRDLGEQTNLLTSSPDKANQLREQLASWERTVQSKR